MKITITTHLSASDLNLLKKIMAQSDFKTLGNYFAYIMLHLTSKNIINPIANSKILIKERPAKPLLTTKTCKINLTITDKHLTKAYLTDLQLALQTNSYWDVSRLWDYALCQILANSQPLFSFNLANNERLLIANVNNKESLAKLVTLSQNS